MDGIDVRLVRAMGVRPHGRVPKDPDALKPSRLARVVGVTEDTVRARLAKLEEDGVVATYQVFPNLGHLGLKATGFYFGPDAAAPDVLATAHGLGRVLEVHEYLGAGMCIEMAYRDDAERERVLAALSARGDAGACERFHEWAMPRVERALTPLDWRILHALRGNAKRPAQEVADALGVSARTVKRRLDRMAAEGSFFAYPRLDLSKATGMLLFELLVYLRADAPADALARVEAAFADRCIHVGRPARATLGNADLVLFAESPGEVDSVRRRAAGLPGVARAESWLFSGVHDVGGWLDAAIAARASAAAAAP